MCLIMGKATLRFTKEFEFLDTFDQAMKVVTEFDDLPDHRVLLPVLMISQNLGQLLEKK